MKGDFSRMTFDASKHFSRVLMQQGRVQLDADWNEQTAILLHYMQTLAKDLIGDHGGPSGNSGFEITDVTGDDFGIGKGRYYVDGVLVENEGKPDNADDSPNLFTYFGQPYYPLNKTSPPLPSGKTILIYLDVWEQLVTSVEDDAIREVALGGPDTAARARVLWQVKFESKMPDGTLEIPSGISEIDSARAWLNGGADQEAQWPLYLAKWQPANRGLLKARAKQNKLKETDPCITSAEASYRGVENQLYRVEIHTKGKVGIATFKWSRDNASVLTGVVLNGNELIVDNPHKLREGQWLELTNDEQELRGEPGVLVEIKHVVCEVVTFNADIAKPSTIPNGEKWPTKARVWESGENNIVENLTTEDKNWLKLEDGIEIQFQSTSGTAEHQYRTGDYWQIPARVATGDVEWPGAEGKPEAIPPHGIEHHYAPLAILNNKQGQGATPIDLRSEFQPLGE